MSANLPEKQSINKPTAPKQRREKSALNYRRPPSTWNNWAFCPRRPELKP
jgi:hypothetical protein